MPTHQTARWLIPPVACLVLAMCAKSSDEEVGAGAEPDRGDTTAVTTQGDPATGQWDTAGYSGLDTAMTDEVGPSLHGTDSAPTPQVDQPTDSVPQVDQPTDSVPQVDQPTDSVPQVDQPTDSVPQ
jgi:hypothetical protein